MRTVRRLVMVALSALAMLALLLAIVSLSFGRWDGVLFYAAVMLISSYVVARLWRGERALKRADEALLPPEQRPLRRVPRSPITFPVLTSAATFAVWYVIAVVVDRVITGTTTTFTLAVVAPFAAFMLATLTIAGRHMAFRLTREEEDLAGRR